MDVAVGTDSTTDLPAALVAQHLSAVAGPQVGPGLPRSGWSPR